MKTPIKIPRLPCAAHKQGFTLVEIMVTLAILLIMAVIAIPRVTTALPSMRLKAAARDLYSNMQAARIGAIKENKDWAIVFDTANDRYYLCSDRGVDNAWSSTGDNTIVKTVTLADYQSGIHYGHGNVPADQSVTNGAFPSDNVSYAGNVAVFNSRGTGSGGYVYLACQGNEAAYAVGSRSSGVIKLFKWYENGWN